MLAPPLLLLLLLQLLQLLGSAAAHMATLSEMQADVVHVQEPPADGPTGCADGSPFKFLVRKGTNANRVLVDFMGGGACWGERCFDSSSILVQTLSGTFQFATALEGQNTAFARDFLGNFNVVPLGFGTDVDDVSTWTYIFVPYCTQDIHLGSCDVTYTSAVSGVRRRVHHNGAANVRAVMDWVYESFAAPDSVGFVGCSAGASAVVLTEAARASVHYASAGTTVVAVGDSPSNLLTEKFVRQGLINWGVGAMLEEVTGWSNATEHLSENLLSEAMAAIFTRHPSVQFAFYTRTADATQLFQYQTMGGMVDGLSDTDAMAVWNRQNLALLEGLQSAHSNFRIFVAEGAGHCAMTFDSALTVSGFKDWVEALLLRGTSGGASTGSSNPAGVTCGAQCTIAGVVGCDGVVGSGALEDRCRVCSGDGSSCARLSSWVPIDTCPAIPAPPGPESQNKLSGGAVREPYTMMVAATAVAVVVATRGVAGYRL